MEKWSANTYLNHGFRLVNLVNAFCSGCLDRLVVNHAIMEHVHLIRA